MSDRPDPAVGGPVGQSVRIALATLQLALLLLALAWACGNIRELPPDRRAVVLRFGRVARVQEAGLVLAMPRPLEEVALLPARDRPIALALPARGDYGPSAETDFQIHQPDDMVSLRAQKDVWNAGYLLTGDGSVVQFDARLFYVISDPAAYLRARAHVEPALQRLYRASAVALAASRTLDDFLVARPERGGADAGARRQVLAADLARAIDRRLHDLAARGEDLGVRVQRVDVVALLPPIAKSAFDAVLTATQLADQQAAAARTQAATTRQQADRDRDRTLAAAAALAEETLRGATASTARIRALEPGQGDPARRASMLDTYFREQIGPILARAGQVITLDPRAGQRLILPGPGPSEPPR